MTADPSKLVALFAPDGHNVHIVPSEAADHAIGVTCWCTPRVEFIAPNGGRIYLHRKANDARYPEPRATFRAAVEGMA